MIRTESWRADQVLRVDIWHNRLPGLERWYKKRIHGVRVQQRLVGLKEKMKYQGGNNDSRFSRKELSPVGSSERNSLSGVAAMVKEVLTRAHVYEDEEDKISYWQLIFLQSKANGCSYRGEDLPHMKWQWPRDTWFQEQLSHHLRDLELARLSRAMEQS